MKLLGTGIDLGRCRAKSSFDLVGDKQKSFSFGILLQFPELALSGRRLAQAQKRSTKR